MHFAYYVCGWQSLAHALPAPWPVSSRARMDSGGDMSGHRLSRLLAPSPRGRPYVLNSDAKVYYIFLIRKKIQRNFQEIFDFVDIQRVTKGAFSRFTGVKRFNGIILYIWYQAGVPYLAPYLIRAGRYPGRSAAPIPGAKPAPY